MKSINKFDKNTIEKSKLISITGGEDYSSIPSEIQSAIDAGPDLDKSAGQVAYQHASWRYTIDYTYNEHQHCSDSDHNVTYDGHFIKHWSYGC